MANEETFSVVTTKETAVGVSLIKQYKLINRKIKNTNNLKITNNSRELINPNCPSGWFDLLTNSVEFKFEGGESGNCDSYRDYNKDLDKQWYFVKIDQSKGRGGTKFKYPGKIKVDGCEGDTLRDVLTKDGRFSDNMFENKKIRDSKGTTHDYSVPIEKLHGKTLKLFKCKTQKEISEKNNENICIDANNSDVLQNESLTVQSTKENADIGNVPSNIPKSPLFELNPTDGSLRNILYELNKTTGINWNVIFQRKAEVSKPKTRNNKKKEDEISKLIRGYSFHIKLSCSIELYRLLSVDHSDLICKLQYPIPNTLETGFATGFMVGILSLFDQRDHVILMTCKHVVDKYHNSMVDQNIAKKCFANFGYHNKDPVDPKDLKTKDYFIKPVNVLVSNESLDYALIALEYSTDLLKLFHYTNGLGKWVCNEDTMPGDKEILRLIGHPAGEPKQMDQLVVISDAKSKLNLGLQIDSSASGPTNVNCEYKPDRMYYQCNSFHGASGSPCFDSNGNVACLHSHGIPINGVDFYNGSKIEIGVSLYSIVKDILHQVEQNQAQELTIDMVYKLFPKFQPPEPMDQS